MSIDATTITEAGRQRGEAPAVALRHHLIESVLRRLAQVPGFVVRGGILTRLWVAPLPRPTRDLDCVGDYPFSVADTADRFAQALALPGDDGVVLDRDGVTAQGIWLHTDFPGVRLTLPLGLGVVDRELTLDIGFGDPLVPPATTLRYTPLVGEPFDLVAVRPETQVAWKLHGLAEMGSEWRPKDLADLCRIAQRVALDVALLPDAITAAFISRGCTTADAVAVLEQAHWTTKTARVRWTSSGVPDLATTLAAVRAVLAPALARL